MNYLESEEEWIYESDSVANIEEEGEARQNANIDPTTEVTYNPLQQFDEYFNNEAENVFSEGTTIKKMFCVCLNFIIVLFRI